MFNVYSEQISYLSKTAVTSVRNRALNLSDIDDAELCVGISGEMFSHKDKPSGPKYHHLPLLLSTGAVTHHQLCLTFWTGSLCSIVHPTVLTPEFSGTCWITPAVGPGLPPTLHTQVLHQHKHQLGQDRQLEPGTGKCTLVCGSGVPLSTGCCTPILAANVK